MKASDKGSLYFNLGLFVFIAVLFFQAISFDKVGRMVPMMILIPLMVLSFFSVLGEIFPKLQEITSPSTQFGFDKGDDNKEKRPLKTNFLSGNRGFLFTAGWIVGFIVMAIIFGFIIAIAVAMFIFFMVPGKIRLIWSAAYALVITLACYLFANVLMGVPLFKGIIFGGQFYI